MSLMNIKPNNMDSTIQIFDNFYNVQVSVSVEQYNLVNAFFLGVCQTKEIANNFTAFLFQVAKMSGLDPMTILASLKGADNKLQVDQKFAYYLNSLKSKTSLYGISVVPRPVIPVARNIVR